MSNAASVSAYITRETIIGAVINALFSLLFVVVIFAGQSSEPMLGNNGLLFDSIPQGLAIGLLGSFFPSFLTRKRIKTGSLNCHAQQAQSMLPQHPFLRALIFAGLGALLTLLAFALLHFAAGFNEFTFYQAMILKVLWGALLGGSVAQVALRLAIRDYSVINRGNAATA